MGRGTPTCLIGLPHDVATLNGGDTLRHDLWGRGRNPPRSELPNTENKFLHPKHNDDLLRESLDLVDERRERAMIHLAYYHHKLKRGYDANVNLKPLATSDLVLRKVVGVAKDPT